MHRKLLQKSMDFEVENRGQSIKKRFKNACCFSHGFFIDFPWILASIWEGLGEVWGPKIGKLGVKKAT